MVWIRDGVMIRRLSLGFGTHLGEGMCRDG